MAEVVTVVVAAPLSTPPKALATAPFWALTRAFLAIWTVSGCIYLFGSRIRAPDLLADDADHSLSCFNLFPVVQESEDTPGKRPYIIRPIHGKGDVVAEKVERSEVIEQLSRHETQSSVEESVRMVEDEILRFGDTVAGKLAARRFGDGFRRSLDKFEGRCRQAFGVSPHFVRVFDVVHGFHCVFEFAFTEVKRTLRRFSESIFAADRLGNSSSPGPGVGFV